MVETHCPSTETLQNILLGRLTREELERWAKHILDCDGCVERAENLQSSDFLTEALQKQSPTSVVPHDIEELLSRGRAVYHDTCAQANDETCEIPNGIPADGSDAEFDEIPESFDFLEPAHREEDLGRLDEYRVLKLLGKGGMGMVFLAEDESLRRRIALKVMMPRLAREQSARERFLREARSMAAVSCDHVVPIYQVGQHNGIPFLAMPLLAGESLKDRLKRDQQLPVRQACQIGREVAIGLHSAKQKGLIHRDVKPDNIWLESPNGRVKILDFGLARGDGDADLTHSGTVLGTPRYMSPEQAEGEKVDFRSDLFSLGSVLYHALTGQPPFGGQSLTSTLIAVVKCDPKPIEELRSDCPTEVADLIMRLLSKDPEERPQSAEEVADQFQALLNDFETARPHASTPSVASAEDLPAPATAKQLSSSRSWLGFATVLTAIAIGFVAILATVVLKWDTPAGTIYVTIDSADKAVEVSIKHDSMQIVDPNDGKTIKLTIDEINQQIRMEKAGFLAQVKQFDLSSPDGRKISVEFVPASVAGRAGSPNVSGKTKLSPPTTIAASERQIAEWVIGHGGSVQLQYGDAEWHADYINQIDDLPTQSFVISGITLQQVEREAELEILTGLSREVSVGFAGSAITGDCLEFVGLIPKLDSLNLQGCQNIDPALLVHLLQAKRLQWITALDSNLGNELAALAGKIPSLSKIEFGNRLTGQGLELLKNAPHVTSIGVVGCTHLRDEDFGLLSDLPNVTSLLADATQVTSVSVGHLAAMPNLRKLQVYDHNATGELDVSALTRLESLEELDISYNELTFEACEPLRELQSLRRLGLRACGLDLGQLYALGQEFPKTEIYWEHGIIASGEKRFEGQTAFLQWLTGLGASATFQASLQGEWFEVNNPERIPDKLVFLGQVTLGTASDADLKNFQDIGVIGGLNLQGSPLTGLGFKYINSMKYNIWPRGLFLEGCNNLRDENLVHLKAMQGLEYLHCNETPVGDALVDVILELPHIGSVGLGRGITGEGLARMTPATKLWQLSFSSDTEIASRDLLPLQQLPALRSLGISSRQATDESLRLLAGIGSLNTLNVVGPLPSTDSFPHLQNIEHLTFMDLDNQACDFSRLEEMTWLKSLTLNNAHESTVREFVNRVRAALPACHIEISN
ncbi:MAG: protein kinase [Planctomycetales bacterium]|nr:protein kinase [Planctomycetales bacterium]